MQLLDTLMRIYLYGILGSLAVYTLIRTGSELGIIDELRDVARRMLGAGVAKWR